MKILTIIGARPQFVKAAILSYAINQDHRIEEVIVHTGQHYDNNMSDIFFRELNIPQAKYNLNIGSGSHGRQTGIMLEKIEEVILKEKPDAVMVYGDTNSTIAGALSAVKVHVPVIHIEAGMRSFNRQMPEEVNRVVTDHLAAINFCSTPVAVKNLENEGRGHTAILVGDVMYDAALLFGKVASEHCTPLAKLGLREKSYLLVTCHRAENTDNPQNLENILAAINELSQDHVVVYPIHPRTRHVIETGGYKIDEKVKLIDPVGYLDMILLEKQAKMIITDSGGVQKEAFFYQVPCVTMRNETEWVETVEAGYNKLAGSDKGQITAAVKSFSAAPPPPQSAAPYGNGDSCRKIIDFLVKSNFSTGKA